MTQTRSFAWRAAEAAIIAAFAYAVGFGLTLAVVVGLLALGVSAAELVGERYGYPVALRHLALCLALVAFTGPALSRGAAWFPVVAVPVAAWFALDALALSRGDTAAEARRADADFGEADLTGELLRALRTEPRRPDELAADRDLSVARVSRALDVLDEAGTVEQDDWGRYRVADDAGRPALLALAARLAERVVRPLTSLGGADRDGHGR